MPSWKNNTDDLDHFVDYATFSEYNYEITVTLNPMLYTRISGDAVGEKLLANLQSWLIPSTDYNPYTVLSISIVKEYTKSKMPHFHCNVAADREIDASFRSNVVKGLQRVYGRSTFKDVVDPNAYLEYMCKDLKKNKDEKGFSHFIISQYV